MKIQKRSVEILYQILNANAYVSIPHLMANYNISRRTVYYELDKINKWLRLVHCEPVQYIRKGGFFLTDGTKQNLKKLKLIDYDESLLKSNYALSSKERMEQIILLILLSEQKITLDTIMRINCVSRNTAIGDVRLANNLLKNYHLMICTSNKKGHYLNGQELDIRNWLMDYVNQKISEHRNDSEFICFLSQFTLLTNKFDLCQLKQQLYEWLRSVGRRLGVSFSDNFLKTLPISLSLFWIRINHQQLMPLSQYNNGTSLKKHPEYKEAIEFIENFLSQQDFHLYMGEVYYIETLLLGSQVNGYFDDRLLFDNKSSELKSIVEEIINRFQQLSGVTFDKIDELHKKLWIHLKSSYFRIKYHITYNEPLLSEVKEEYKEIFDLTKKAIIPFERFCQNNVNENEIAFIAMYFGGWLTKIQIVKYAQDSVLVVCSSGFGTSHLLKHQLEQLFPIVHFKGPISEHDYLEREVKNERLVISTVKLSDQSVPTCVVHPILTAGDKDNLYRVLYNYRPDNKLQINQTVEGLLNIVNEYTKINNIEDLRKNMISFLSQPVWKEQGGAYKPMLNELLTKDKIILADHVDNWEQAIAWAAKPLKEQGYITNDYIQAMIDSVHTNGPYVVVTPKVALPHARPEQGVNRLGLSLMKLETGVDFGVKKGKVYIVIVLAAHDNESHLKALSQLAGLLGKPQEVNHLISCKSAEEIEQVINQYSK